MRCRPGLWNADPARVGEVIDGIAIRTFGELIDVISAKVEDEESRHLWAGRSIGQGTVNAFVRRLVFDGTPELWHDGGVAVDIAIIDESRELCTHCPALLSYE